MDRREFFAAAASAAAASATVASAAAASAVAVSATAAGAAAAGPASTIAPTQERREPFRLSYAPHFGMFQSHAKELVDQIEFMADQGFTAFEDNAMRQRDVATQEAIARALQRRGMQMGIFVCNDRGIGHPILTSGDAAARDAFLQNVRHSVEVAKRLDTKVCTLTTGDVSPRLPLGYQTVNVAETLKRACDILAPHGIVMVAEPLNFQDHPGYFLTHIHQAYALVKMVGSPSLKILFDMYHQQISEGNILANVERAWDEIGYFQIGDVPGRREPTTGEMHYRNIFRHLHGKGWRGILGMEHGNARPGKDGELALIAAYRECDSF